MLIIGNGESRKDLDIDSIDDIKIGCNAIFRDFRVTFLSCCDRRMVQEAVESKVNNHTTVYTRTDWIRYFKNENNIKTYPDLPYTERIIRPDEPFQWGSGPYAVLLGAMFNNSTNRLIGFDCWGSGDGKRFINNVYKGTKNYHVENYRATGPSYWIHQIGKVIECFPNQKFIFYNNADWEMPKEWIHPNSEKKVLTKLKF
jgi:hypothetical protein